jgi:hypothetical protein
MQISDGLSQIVFFWFERRTKRGRIKSSNGNLLKHKENKNNYDNFGSGVLFVTGVARIEL